MIPRRFPFAWTALAVSSATTTPSVTTALWTKLTAGLGAWGESALQRIPRFEHVYPQVAQAFARDVDFAHRVQTEFPFVIATGNAVVIASSITGTP